MEFSSGTLHYCCFSCFSAVSYQALSKIEKKIRRMERTKKCSKGRRAWKRKKEVQTVKTFNFIKRIQNIRWRISFIQEPSNENRRQLNCKWSYKNHWERMVKWKVIIIFIIIVNRNSRQSLKALKRWSLRKKWNNFIKDL